MIVKKSSIRIYFFVMVLFDFISSTIFFGGVTKEAKNKAKTNR